MKALWINDIHLEFLDDRRRKLFLSKLNRSDADGILIAGDIGQAPSVIPYLEEIEAVVQRPIYFALGNHDYYYGSISSTRTSIGNLAKRSSHLRWVNESGVTKTVLIGHDGWGDGRLGDFRLSRVELNDFLLIRELSGLSRRVLLRRIGALGDEAADHLRALLPEALSVADHVVVLTHVPPFVEAAWHRGRYCEPDWLPFFTCKAAGDVLKAAMQDYPDKQMTVLCGHTHGGGEWQILPNLVAYTGAARYGRPAVQGIFDWD
jgi:3',5'-cyclic-AMP phosphodiesterase